MHRATEEQAQSECEWKRGKGVSSWIVGASVITLTLTKAAFSWKPFGRLTDRIVQIFYRVPRTFCVSQWETDTQKLTLQMNLQSCWKVRSLRKVG
jgi:hypothetical protein